MFELVSCVNIGEVLDDLSGSHVFYLYKGYDIGLFSSSWGCYEDEMSTWTALRSM